MGSKLSLFLLYSTSSGVRAMGGFSILPCLVHWQKFQKFHIHVGSTPGAKIEIILALWAVVSEIQADSQNFAIFRHET